jgi:NAD(P)-dependent dehydrogenase (short-subunit alcohol dehydrogenase family)
VRHEQSVPTDAVAVITGGGTGIGRGAALVLADPLESTAKK